MPNATNRQKIIERLKLDTDMELMRHEIEQMLDRELAKPAEEIDTQLVQELLVLLDSPSPTNEEKEATWETIQHSINKPRKSKWKTVVLRCATAAAAICVLFFVTVQTAEAFRWTFLLKLLSPVAETFGIYSASNPDYDHSENAEAVYTDEKTDYAQVNYSSLEEMPTELHGVRVVPSWMMDGYTFVQGSIYQDPYLAKVFVAYECNDEYVLLTTQVFLDEEAVSGYEFEQSFQKSGSEQIAEQQVTLYCNNQGEIEAYSWVQANTHYVLSGKVSIDDLAKIIEGLMA